MKKKIKSWIDNIIIPLIGRFKIQNNKYCNVIYYHDIVEGSGDSFDLTNFDVFKRHMEYLINQGYETITFDELNSDKLAYSPKRVLIAFDDGWTSNYDLIFKYMQERGLKYNIFLAVGLINNDSRYLTWAKVREMNKSGIVGFGAHTYSHVCFKDIKEVDVDKEIKLANDVFYNELGFYPQDFCYPYGYYSETSHKYLIEKTCYKRIYTSKKMYSYSQSGKIIFGRCGISNEQSFEIYVKKLKGYFNYTETFYRSFLSLFLQKA